MGLLEAQSLGYRLWHDAVAQRIAAFLRRALGPKVFVTYLEEHAWEAAVVRGVTHQIAKVLARMEPLPTLITRASFDHLMQATEMVRYDAPSVYMAIERDNPFASASSHWPRRQGQT